MMQATITHQELSQITQPNHHIIDIRTPYEYSKNHIPKAVNIPYDILMMYPDSYLKRDQVYYLICAHGSLSHRACAILQSYGYKVASVKNGYKGDLRCYYC
jgi:rhodanese-related sulfurtransferase